MLGAVGALAAVRSPGRRFRLRFLGEVNGQDEADDGTLATEVEASFWSRHRVRYPGPCPGEVIESSQLCHHSRDGELATVSVILSHHRSEA